jgi:hypothetical protein
MADQTCGHPNCKCPIEEGKEYCSEHCKRAAEAKVNQACHCHHKECGPHSH